MLLEQVNTDMPKKKKIKNLDTDLTHFTKINSKWIIDLRVKCKTVKLLNIGENPGEQGFGDDLVDKTPKPQSVMKKWSCERSWTSLKLKTLAPRKTPLGEWKDQATDWVKIF